MSKKLTYAKMTILICPSCQYQNTKDRTTCYRCGRLLRSPLDTLPPNGMQRSTAPLLTQGTKLPADSEDALQSTNVFPTFGFLRIEIFGEPRPLIIKMEEKILIGRRDPSLVIQPDIDFSPYSGYRMGISRNHAQLVRTEHDHLVLVDLGSANGTFINEKRLTPHAPNKVRSGDEVAFAQLITHIHFD